MSFFAQLTVALVAAVTPSPSPSAPTILVNEDLVTPGWIGFVAIFLVGLAVIALVVDMVRRIRRVNYRAEIREKLDAEETARRNAADR